MSSSLKRGRVPAISIRQPYVELILRGSKTREYRSRPTSILERVYLYASLRPAECAAEWRKVRKRPGDLPTGVILGSVEIVDCRWDERMRCFAYLLNAPKRLAKHRRPIGQPTPCFWRPGFTKT
jgi:hypothetical protein